MLYLLRDEVLTEIPHSHCTFRKKNINKSRAKRKSIILKWSFRCSYVLFFIWLLSSANHGRAFYLQYNSHNVSKPKRKMPEMLSIFRNHFKKEVLFAVSNTVDSNGILPCEVSFQKDIIRNNKLKNNQNRTSSRSSVGLSNTQRISDVKEKKEVLNTSKKIKSKVSTEKTIKNAKESKTGKSDSTTLLSFCQKQGKKYF